MTKVAIIGAGPCGLSMLRSFEQEEKKGDWRSPPANLEAEQALLGATLINNRAFEQVSDFLTIS